MTYNATDTARCPCGDGELKHLNIGSELCGFRVCPCAAADTKSNAFDRPSGSWVGKKGRLAMLQMEREGVKRTHWMEGQAMNKAIRDSLRPPTCSVPGCPQFPNDAYSRCYRHRHLGTEAAA